MTSPLKLAIGIPAYKSQVHVGHTKMWLGLGYDLFRRMDQIHLQGFIDMDVCGVEKARNFILAHAMILNADWVLMVDADTWVNHGSTLIRMILDGDRLGATIVGAPVIRNVDGVESLNVLNWQAGVLRPLEAKLGQEMVKVDAIGAAVMAIDLRKIANASFKFTEELSEDLDFCVQVCGLGGSTYADFRVKTYHAKSYNMIYEPR